MTDGNPLPTAPVLRDECRLSFDENRDQHLLLYPEGTIALNETGHEILSRLNGQKSVASLIDEIEADFDEENLGDQVRSFLRGINEQNVLTDG